MWSGRLLQMREAVVSIYHRRWTAELAVRSMQTLTTISVFALNWCRLHVEVRHRDRPIPAPGYADSGRRGRTVHSPGHAVAQSTSAGREEVALRSRTSVSRRSDVQQRSRQTAACRTCSLVNRLTWRCHSPVVTGPKRRSATARQVLWEIAVWHGSGARLIRRIIRMQQTLAVQ